MTGFAGNGLPAILVTGGAGFIGSNFVLDWLGAGAGEGCGPVVNLDKLTYAGNLENLASVADSREYRFVRGTSAMGS